MTRRPCARGSPLRVATPTGKASASAKSPLARIPKIESRIHADRTNVGCACYLCARQAKWHLHCAGIYMPSTRTTPICQLKTNVPAANQHQRREGRAKRSVELREFKYHHSRKLVRKVERRELDTNVLRG